jgi:hypothetical protein
MAGSGSNAVDNRPVNPAPVTFIDFGFAQSRFLVTVDTEEEFDWSAPFSRDQHGTTHIASIARFQALCDQHAVRPAYLIDYPIANDDAAVDLLGGFVGRGVADVGVQLHPWVNPPFDEDISSVTSYACNLPPELERAKLTALHSLIVERFGMRPQIYRAGRYGAGYNTRRILRDLGIGIDTSVRSLFDYTPQGGPDYAECPLDPYWIYEGELLELPLTTVFSGALQKIGPKMFSRAFGAATSRGILARTGMLERLALTPEGIPADKAKLAIDLALAQKVPVLNFSFHSPSLAVGHTPYVRNDHDLERFYDWWRQIFAHLEYRGVKPTHVDEMLDAVGMKQ